MTDPWPALASFFRGLDLPEGGTAQERDELEDEIDDIIRSYRGARSRLDGAQAVIDYVIGGEMGPSNKVSALIARQKTISDRVAHDLIERAFALDQRLKALRKGRPAGRVDHQKLHIAAVASYYIRSGFNGTRRGAILKSLDEIAPASGLSDDEVQVRYRHINRIMERFEDLISEILEATPGKPTAGSISAHTLSAQDD